MGCDRHHVLDYYGGMSREVLSQIIGEPADQRVGRAPDLDADENLESLPGIEAVGLRRCGRGERRCED
jgi:hypothetical protein